MGGSEAGRGFCAATVATLKSPTLSFWFSELMFQRDNFLFHFAEFHVFCCATRLVKQVNKSAWKTANENNNETQRPDEDGFRLRNTAKPVEHDLQNFFTAPDSGETDRHSRNR